MGLNHKISIPSILEIGFNKKQEVGSILKEKNFNNALIIFDEYINSIYGDEIVNQISGEGIQVTSEVIPYPKVLEVSDLVKWAYSLPMYDVIIGMGGGAVIDYGKYISYLKKIKYISIPTSASNDGFASTNASLISNGRKMTIPAKIPYGIIVDVEIVKKAPDKLILAGVGDLLSNITALYDWEYEARQGVGEKDDFALMLSKKAVNSFVRTPFTSIKDNLFLKEMVESMVMGGISTEITGNSSPISGSEHLIAHALDKISATPIMHGIAVGIATYIVGNIQDGHRTERIKQVLTDTGFFEYAKTLNLQLSEFERAIDLAPSIKPYRKTYIHIEKNRELAIKFIKEDSILKEILK